jgi:copper chaperone NosL
MNKLTSFDIRSAYCVVRSVVTRPLRTTNYVLLIALALLFTALTACQSSVDLEQPPDIRYGEDVCDLCGMIISEARFAAGYITAEGETRRFDDIGNMVAYHLEMGEDVAVFWVHDYETAVWLRADEATLAYVADLITPMGSGLVAFADPDAAAEAVAGGGEVMDFPTLLAEAKSGNVANSWFHKHHDHGDHNHDHDHDHHDHGHNH